MKIVSVTNFKKLVIGQSTQLRTIMYGVLQAITKKMGIYFSATKFSLPNIFFEKCFSQNKLGPWLRLNLQ